MQQTLLAFCAILIAGLWGLSQQRAILEGRLTMMRGELEGAAVEVAREVLEHIGTKPFDAAVMTSGGRDLGTASLGGSVSVSAITSPTQLTWPPFPTGRRFEQCQDIDDFHGIQPYTYTTPDGLRFEVQVQVRYVNPDDPTQGSSTPTFAKEATVTVTHPELRAPVRLSRVYTYP
ncbi:MAG: hypothetical protein N2561_09785 [Bacteroidetes bacterium]|nr:hypothetical protein [Rhodothermia bacterium]MCS7155221.1 hypothetical protein [Bacteroidota bacterium]MCX7907806.1 hypothetical protein [Bacteroidota bacterium]MDW8138625.1 hypothetical protein [Bacteroidota bacterium]MDW8284789.1 hypothetical protein [Bacteroidota bacterium]